nr:29 kda immunodominant polypeptide {N-terminal} [Theileria sergenti, merozoite, Korean isolate, host=cattle, Peptide Partial, 20 aa] [Theileria sergenti]
ALEFKDSFIKRAVDSDSDRD